MNKSFNESLQAALVAAGFTEKEIEHGALMAEMHAAIKLVGNPLAAMAIGHTFSKALAILSVVSDTKPERICAASDMIFDAASAHSKKVMADAAEAAAPRTVN
jgi:hypothetical protein